MITLKHFTFFVLAGFTPLLAQTEHGTIQLLNDPVATTSDLQLGLNTTPRVSLPVGTNRGDYWLDIDPAGAEDEGIIISSAAIHLSGGNAVVTSGYPSPSVAQRHFISFHQANSFGEDDTWASFAFFPKDQFLVGQAINSVNNQTLNALAFSSPGISFSSTLGDNPGAEFVGTATGISTLDLTGLSASSQDGILLVNGAKNENNIALSKANADGTFTIYCKDVTLNGNGFESDPVSFVYLPLDHASEQIVALGRIGGDGARLLENGDFSVTSGNNGTWRLGITGHSNLTGTLIISPEGGGVLNIDNIWAHQWDPVAGDWIIESRDLPGTGLQSVGSDPAFSFVFLTDAPRAGVVYVDASASAGGDGESWATAYQDLNDAFSDLRYGDEIWVTEGTYKPTSEQGFTIDTGTVKLYGGFPAGGGDGSFDARNSDPATNNTVLSGDIDSDNDTNWPDPDNAVHVVSILPHLTDCILDGFTITAGNADGSGNAGRGGGVFISNNSDPTLENLLFQRNHCINDGGAVMVETGGTIRPTFRTVIFRDNSAESDGGAIYNWERASDFINVAFLGNVATNRGGAVFNDENSSSFINCAFQGNQAVLGGAINNIDSSPTIISASFQGNRATSLGGAILDSSSSAAIINTIIWNNRDINGLGSVSSAYTDDQSTTTFGSSLVQGRNLGGTNLDGTDPANDPLFLSEADPANAPTTDGDLRLQSSSPALNAGLNSANTTPTDLAGNLRIAPFRIDLGAYELQALSVNPDVELSLLFPLQDLAINENLFTDTTGFNSGSGFEYLLTPASNTGTLSFETPPTIDTSGTVSFTINAQTHGSATFDVSLSDPQGNFEISPSKTFTIIVAEGNFPEEANLQPSVPLRAYICVRGIFPDFSRCPPGGDVLSEVKFFASDFNSDNYLPTEGQILNISNESALFSLIGSRFGGNGETTFALPDLRGRVPIGTGMGPGLTNYSLGDSGGQLGIDSADIPTHSHTTIAGSTNTTSSGTPFSNRQPYLALTPVLMTEGSFPGQGSQFDPSQSYLGEVRWFANNFFESCSARGQLLPIASNTALFSLMLTTYGGNGQSTFQLPDLRGRAVIAVGSRPGLTTRSVGDSFGTETEMLTEATMPSHSHNLLTGGISGLSGGGQPFNNMMPSLALRYVVCPDTGEVRIMTTIDDRFQSPADGLDGRPNLAGSVVIGESEGLTYNVLRGNELTLVTPSALPDHSHTGPAYLDWMSQFYPNEADPAVVGLFSQAGQPYKNVLQFVLDADPRTYDPSLLPELSRDDTHASYVFRRRDDSGDFDTYVEYGTNLTTWSRANNGEAGVSITFDEDAYGPGVDRVTVNIPRNSVEKIFARLVVDE